MTPRSGHRVDTRGLFGLHSPRLWRDLPRETRYWKQALEKVAAGVPGRWMMP